MATESNFFKVGAAWVGERGISVRIKRSEIVALQSNEAGDVPLFMAVNDKKETDKHPDYVILARKADKIHASEPGA